MDVAPELNTLVRQLTRRIEGLERQVSQHYSKRDATVGRYYQVRIARTVLDEQSSPTYPADPGQFPDPETPIPNTFPIVFLDPGFVLGAGFVDPAFTPHNDKPQTFVNNLDNKYIPVNTEIEVFQLRGTPSEPPGEWWCEWNDTSQIVYFQLYDDKLLDDSFVLAKILKFDEASNEWSVTDTFIKVYDSYYNAPGFFTGTAGIDRGWAILREKAEDPEDPDDYEVIWMSGPAHVVEFTLTNSRSFDGSAEFVTADCAKAFLYGNTGISGAEGEAMPEGVWFRQDYFPRALKDAKGTAVYDDEDRRYRVIQCDQLCTDGVAILTADMCGASAGVEDFTPSSFWPFSQPPDGQAGFGTGGGSGSVLNINGHRGLSGDIVKLKYIEYLDSYDVYDVSKHPILVGGPLVDSGDDLVQDVWRIAAEICEPPIENRIFTERCGSGSGGSGQ